MTGKRHRRRGGSALEFAMLTGVWVPLLVGTTAIGSTMIRGLQVVHVARDAAHMYALGVDFSLSGSQDMLGKLSSDLGSLTSSGDGLVVFSTLEYVGRYVCQSAGYADTSTPPNPTTSCRNYGHFVFTHRWMVGNTSLRTSNIGAPSVGVDANTGVIPLNTYVTQTGDRADAFTAIPAPRENGSDGYQAGDPIYLVEVFFRGGSFAGYTQGGTYAAAIF